MQERSRDRRERWLFVTGANRSGTTWVGRMLDEHPEVMVRGECAFFREDAGIDWCTDAASVSGWVQGCSTSAALFCHIDPASFAGADVREVVDRPYRRVFAPWAGVRVLGDRTPYHSCVCADRLHAAFPDSVFVDVVRDGRDTAVSSAFKQVMQRKSVEMWGGPARAEAVRCRIEEGARVDDGSGFRLFTDEALEFFARRWVRSVTGGERASVLYGDRFVRLRYESLVEDAVPGIAMVFGLLGVADPVSNARRAVERQRFERVTGRARGRAEPGSLARSASPGDWRSWFTARDGMIFEGIAGKTLSRLGYAGDGAVAA
ncbi:MAG TPA: sulfotransferase [Phycisphaerales bacterium]|nr:sulfotransferase [Phycisphaerales bacterium]